MKKLTIFTTLIICITVASCKKSPSDGNISNSDKLSYGDSIFYVKASNYTVSPNISKAGTYTAFPTDLNIDNNTGKITVSVNGKSGTSSQTGLRYRITFTSTDGVKDSTDIVIAGINYQDKIYYAAQNQYIVNPIYNATPSLTFPGGVFSSSNSKLAIDPTTGKIDLKQSVVNSLFHNDPRDGDWKEVTIYYKTNDNSTATNNSINVVIYFYPSVASIPSNVSGAMRAHQDLLLGLTPENIPQTSAPVDNDIKNIVFAFKPRPPCIILLGN